MINSEIERLEAEYSECEAKLEKIKKRKFELPENVEVREKVALRIELIKNIISWEC